MHIFLTYLVPCKNSISQSWYASMSGKAMILRPLRTLRRSLNWDLPPVASHRYWGMRAAQMMAVFLVFHFRSVDRIAIGWIDGRPLFDLRYTWVCNQQNHIVMSERPIKRKLSKRQFCKDHVFIYQGESEYIRIAVDDRCLDARLRHPRLDRGSHNDEIAGQAGDDEEMNFKVF